MKIFLILFIATCFLVYQIGKYEATHRNVDK
jgi:hypothetical protein